MANARPYTSVNSILRNNLDRRRPEDAADGSAISHPNIRRAVRAPPARHPSREVIHRRGSWRSLEAVEIAPLDWVDWFNNRRLLKPIGSMPPAEAEANYYADLEVTDIAA